MPSLFRSNAPRVEHTVPPAELSAAERIAEVDRHLLSIALIPEVLRTAAQWSSLDVLLDRRLDLKRRGVVLRPVIPGRTSC